MDVIPTERLAHHAIERLRAAHHRLDAIGSELAPNSVYSRVQARLDTFRHWPATHIVTPQALAEAGFVYMNDRDRVQCAFCHGGIHNWLYGDIAMGEHRKHFPCCRYVIACDYHPHDVHEGPVCKVCMDAEVDCLFLPCRHVVCCRRCSSLVKQCAVCRNEIDAVVKVFLA